MDSAITDLLNHAVSSRTLSSYNVGVDLYKRFLLLQGFVWKDNELPPVSEILLMRFVAYCDEHKNLKYSTVKLYLCGIRFYYLRFGGFNPIECNGRPMICLKTILTGLKKKVPNVKRIRLPITVNILYRMCKLLRSNIFSNFVCVMLEAACVMAFLDF